MTIRLTAVPVVVAVLSLLTGLCSAAEPDFTRDVRPLLSRNCFKCHGPDDKARKSGLRLDVREAALKPARSGSAAIVPGKPDESELIARIFSDQAGERMPPPATKLTLSEKDKDTLRRWIAAGAEYRSHWAFVPPRQVPLPTVKQTDWPRNPIDRFVLARLEAAGLSPSPPANRAMLIRRISLDLIGLPPMPEEVDAFVNDSSHDAYERLVDRLLASPHYGERWARRWLDLARYADTNGYEKDRPRSIWPYRDWVIRALNSDMPFDLFTVEQLAGDLLPNSTLEQKIATGFHRNTMLNEEGGIDPLEFRFHAMTDRVGTTGTTWLGLTIGCAQCHTHKYDPIPHREYYQLFAFLNNADEPDLDLPLPEVTARRREIEAKIAQLVAALPGRFPGGKEALERKFGEWREQERQRAVQWTVLRPVEAKSNLPLLTVQDDDSVFVSGDTTKSDTYELKYRTNLQGIAALRLEALPDDRLPKHGPGLTYYEGPKGDFFLGELLLRADAQPVKLGRATETYAKLGIGGGKTSAALAVDGDPQTGWSTSGREGEAHVAVFQLAQPLAESRELVLTMHFGRHYAASLGRFRIAVTTDARAPAARDIPHDVEQFLLGPDDRLSSEERARLLRHFLLTTPELAAARMEIDSLRKQLPAYPTTLVLRERPAQNPRPTFLHQRGEFLQPAERVEPGVLSVLPGLPKDALRDRLGFARWLVSPDNPLTARVTVNRQWAVLFGRGIVRTTEDFGFQGEAPTHPELLDWLAVEFIQRGWSLKQLHRLIVLSATYQQSSRVSLELRERDPDNRLLGRAPRLRLEAELIRDSVLRASGLLSAKMGGPSVYPPQPASVTTEGTYGKLTWAPSQGEDRYRRGLYTFTKRTAPFAMFSTFDAPSGEACVARRDVSNTPLQALTLLNDVVFTEAAQALGKTFVARSGSVDERIHELYRRCLSRPPSTSEVADLGAFWAAQKHRFEARELDARAVAGDGPGDVNERAAWTALARVLFNLDEAVVK